MASVVALSGIYTAYPEYKDTGIEWLGEVPAHWVPMQIRRILPLMEQGKSPECNSRVADIHE
jgi:type I restriction enzyme S subunit